MHYLGGDAAGLLGVLSPVLSGGIVTAESQSKIIAQLRRTPSVAAALTEAAVTHAHRGPNAAAQAVETLVLVERLRLERGLGILSTIATNAPFVGLLGTVIGVMHAFAALGAEHPQVDLTGPLMRGVAEALVTTGVGLAVALPAVVAHNFLQSRGEATLSSARALAGQVVVALAGSVGESLGGSLTPSPANPTSSSRENA